MGDRAVLAVVPSKVSVYTSQGIYGMYVRVYVWICVCVDVCNVGVCVRLSHCLLLGSTCASVQGSFLLISFL